MQQGSDGNVWGRLSDWFWRIADARNGIGEKRSRLQESQHPLAMLQAPPLGQTFERKGLTSAETSHPFYVDTLKAGNEGREGRDECETVG